MSIQSSKFTITNTQASALRFGEQNKKQQKKKLIHYIMNGATYTVLVLEKKKIKMRD